MADKEAGEDLPQFNYRVPGEPETIASESKETPESDTEEVKDKVSKAQDKADKQRELGEKARDDDEVSPDHGQSPPQTQLEIDNENTWSGPGGREK